MPFIWRRYPTERDRRALQGGRENIPQFIPPPGQLRLPNRAPCPTCGEPLTAESEAGTEMVESPPDELPLLAESESMLRPPLNPIPNGSHLDNGFF